MMLSLLGPSVTTAATLDGTSPFLCAVIQALECDPDDGTCEKQSVEEMNFPRFIRVDPKAKTITANEPGGRMAAVHDIVSVDGKFVMYGGQLGRGWSAVVAAESGKMSVSVVDEKATFVIFGACTKP